MPDEGAVPARGPRRASRLARPAPPPCADEGAAVARALNALAARAHTVRQMDARLARAGFAPVAVDLAVTRMRDLGYLDDEAYAEGYVTSRRAHRLHGIRRLRHDLSRRGVDDAIIEAATVDDGAECERAAAVADRILPSLADLNRASAMRRLAGALGRRGFGAPVISQVVRDALAMKRLADAPSDHLPTDTLDDAVPDD